VNRTTGSIAARDESIEAEAMLDKSNAILLVDDDVKLNRLIRQYLEANGFSVTEETDGERSIARIIEESPLLVVLDIMLPGADGLSVCRSVREHYHGPIIMLTAMGDDIDEVVGLETGADDYLAKPVRPRVLLAHIRALLRRMEDAASDAAPTRIELHDIVIDQSKRMVRKGGEMLDLTTAEFDLLWLLAGNAGKVLDRDELHRKIFRLEYDGTDRTIDLRVSRIRRKIEDDPKHPAIIKTVRGLGYLFST